MTFILTFGLLVFVVAFIFGLHEKANRKARKERKLAEKKARQALFPMGEETGAEMRDMWK
jgi:hypothetical protein